MPVIWSNEAKAAQMLASYQLIVGGAVELGTDDMKVVLASILLPPGECGCTGTAIVCAPEAGAYASATGRASCARIVDSTGKPVLTGLVVAKIGTKNAESADALIDHVDIRKGQIVTIAQMQITY